MGDSNHPLSPILAVPDTLGNFTKKEMHLPLEKVEVGAKTERLLKALSPFEQKKEIRRLTKKHHRRNDFTERLELLYVLIRMNNDRETVSLLINI